jgi:hypothetical protein
MILQSREMKIAQKILSCVSFSSYNLNSLLPSFCKPYEVQFWQVTAMHPTVNTQNRIYTHFQHFTAMAHSLLESRSNFLKQVAMTEQQ